MLSQGQDSPDALFNYLNNLLLKVHNESGIAKFRCDPLICSKAFELAFASPNEMSAAWSMNKGLMIEIHGVAPCPNHPNNTLVPSYPKYPNTTYPTYPNTTTYPTYPKTYPHTTYTGGNDPRATSSLRYCVYFLPLFISMH